MQKITARFLVLFLFVCGGLNTRAVEIESRVDFASRYIWRGFDLNPYRQPVIQPSVEVGWPEKGLALTLWSSFSFVNRAMNEIDLTVSYRRKISEFLVISGGLIHYGWYFTGDFRLGEDTSQELFVSAGLSCWGVQSDVTLFYDFTNGDGFYGLLSAQYPLKITRGLDMAVHASLGYNGGQWLAEETNPGFSDLNAGLSVDWGIGPLIVGANVNYTLVLLKAIGRENHFWFGFSLSYLYQGNSK